MIDTASRIAAAQAKLHSQGLGAILISNHYNLQYLFSFAGLSSEEREGWGLITPNDAYLFTDSRYEIRSENGEDKREKNFHTKLIDYQHKLSDQIQQILAEKGVKNLGFEQDDLTYTEFIKLKETLNKVELVPVKGFVENFRAIKDTGEIATLKQACQFTDTVLQNCVQFIKIGATEAEIAGKIQHMIHDRGLQLSFDPIISLDANSAIPHYNTSLQGSTKVKKGSVVLIDMGVKYRGYCADITRMFFVKPVVDEVKNTYKKLLGIQEQTVVKAQANTRASEVDLFCRQLITDNFELSLPHATGHGVGLQIHESPSISPPSKDILRQNMVFTIEPGVYIPNKWGMRIEDTVLIDSNGHPTALTQYPKHVQAL